MFAKIFGVDYFILLHTCQELMKLVGEYWELVPVTQKVLTALILVMSVLVLLELTQPLHSNIIVEFSLQSL